MPNLWLHPAPMNSFTSKGNRVVLYFNPTNLIIKFIAIVSLVLVLISFGVGYQLGTPTSNLSAIHPKDTKESFTEVEETEDEKEAEDDDDDDDEELEDIPDGDLGSVSAGFIEPCKLVRPLNNLSLKFDWYRFWLFVQILK